MTEIETGEILEQLLGRAIGDSRGDLRLEEGGCYSHLGGPGKHYGGRR